MDQALTQEDRDQLANNGYTITSQSFRDSYVLHLLHRTAELTAVMEAAGHADTTTTRRYLAILPTIQDELDQLP